MSTKKLKLIVILGQTASGKSDLAAELAKKFNGEVISADSRQIYRWMNLGTGKVPRDKKFNLPLSDNDNNSIAVRQQYFYKGIRHHLLDIADPKRRFTVAQYKKLAEKAIKDILRRGKIPIICGGTGFYIQAITENLQIPAVKPDLKLRAKLEKKSAEELFSELKRLDPARAATIDPHNPRRLIRALEIIYKTGKPVPALVIPAKAGIRNSKPGFRIKSGMTNNFNILYLGVKKSPTELKKLIYKRLLKRFKQGMIKEVQNLRASGLSWKRLNSFGLEYRWVARYLRGKTLRKGFDGEISRTAQGISYKEMVSLLQKDIERFAKRQMTWFKKYEPKTIWVSNKKEAQKIASVFLKK